jgi:hypothetical protein
VTVIDGDRLSLFDTPSAAVQVLEPTVGPSHAIDPPTSRQAARSNAVRSGTQRHAVLAAFAVAVDGLTDYEASIAAHLVRPHVAGNRRKELEDAGYVERTARTRPTDTGCEALVFFITDAGRRVLAEIEEATR